MGALRFSAGVVSLLLTFPAFAATWTWTGGAGNNNWTNTPNWSPVSAPANDGTADLVFGPTARVTPDLSANWSVNSLTFKNTAPFYSLVSTLDNTLTIGAGGITNGDTDMHSIKHAIALSAAQTWSFAPQGGVSVEGAINNGGNLLTIDTSAAANFFLLGTLTGAGGLTKNGTGTMLLANSSPNTFSGVTTVNGGLLELQASGGVNSLAGSLVIGSAAATNLAVVDNVVGNQIPDNESVSVFPNAIWKMTSNVGVNETITDLNITGGTPGNGSVQILDGTLTILGTLNMTGGSIVSHSSGGVRLNGRVVTSAAGTAAAIDSRIDFAGGIRTFTVDRGTAPIDLDITGALVNGGFVKDGPGILRLGAASTYTGGTALIAGTILIGNDAALGTGPIVDNGGALAADGGARTIANAITGGNLAVSGDFDLTLSSAVNITGGITKSGPAMLVFSKGGAISDALAVNAGTVRFDADFVAGGLTNQGTVLFGTHTLTVDGVGLDNQGSVPLAGGMLAGSGPLVNNILMAGYGVIGGSGGFTNNSQLTMSGGNLTLANSGANANAGNLTVPVGLQLRLTGSDLSNTGTIELAGGVVAGTAMLSNDPGGTVTGRGLISAPFANAGGTLRPAGGTLNVTTPFLNSGLIRLEGGAGLAGGAISNAGRIQGDGSIANAIANTGEIEAIGTLALGGALTNTGTGLIGAGPGNRVVVTAGLIKNEGTINLTGGTFTNNGFPLDNSGQISGFGVLSSGGLTNNGTMTFTGGLSVVNGPLANAAGKTIAVRQNPAIFTGLVTNNGTFEVTATTATFAGGFGGNPIPAPLPAPTTPAPQVGNTLIKGGGQLQANFLRQNSLSLDGTVVLRAKAAGGGTSILNSLTLTTQSRLDLADNALIIDYDSTSPLPTLRAQIASGYAGGTWTGNGIISSSAAANSAMALGYGEASEILGISGSTLATWNGQTVDATSVLIRDTLAGDADLNGKVDFADLVKLAQNYGVSNGSATWSKGDFNYDGNVGFADLVAVAQHYGTSLPSSPLPAESSFDGDRAAMLEAPEPSTSYVLLIAAGAMALRRRS